MGEEGGERREHDLSVNKNIQAVVPGPHASQDSYGCVRPSTFVDVKSINLAVSGRQI